jgi:hypothetical protein
MPQQRTDTGALQLYGTDTAILQQHLLNRRTNCRLYTAPTILLPVLKFAALLVVAVVLLVLDAFEVALPLLLIVLPVLACATLRHFFFRDFVLLLSPAVLHIDDGRMTR